MESAPLSRESVRLLNGAFFQGRAREVTNPSGFDFATFLKCDIAAGG